MDSKEFEFVKRSRLYTDSEFWFEVDEYSRFGSQLLIAHVRVERWLPSVRKECHRVWNAFLRCVPGPIYTYGITDDDKFERFVRGFGYEPLLSSDDTPAMITCVNGERRRLFIHKGLT